MIKDRSTAGVVVTAPDPGLTDLIAAHPRLPIHVFEDRHRYRCLCGWFEDVEPGEFTPHPAHVALVVEQRSNGRIRELEATIARVKALVQDEDGDWLPYWRATTSEIRAALEGEQQ